VIRCLRLAIAALVVVLAGVASTTTAAALTSTYDSPPLSRVGVSPIEARPIACPLIVGSPAEPAPGSLAASDSSTTADPSRNATNTGGVLKGAIPDAVPSNLTQQLALTEARASGGAQIMANLADNPRLVAVYGEGEWVKMQSVLRGTDANTTVHWFKNLTTGLEVEFKFK
jgi:hypothetical protein